MSERPCRSSPDAPVFRWRIPKDAPPPPRPRGQAVITVDEEPEAEPVRSTVNDRWKNGSRRRKRQ